MWNDDDNVTWALKAVEWIVKTVPVYEDALQPAAKELGKSLETITKTINVALSPISALVWWYEKIQDFIEVKVSQKLKDVPQERIITPTPLIAGPLLESLKYTWHEETLQEMYANLLANSMDSQTESDAHPWFVEILKNMNPDEAKIMRLFSVEDNHAMIDVKWTFKKEGWFRIYSRNFSFLWEKSDCKNPLLTPNYLDNLCRLWLLEIPNGRHIIQEGLYEKLQESENLKEILQILESDENITVGFDKKKIQLTSLGKQFCRACVIDKWI